MTPCPRDADIEPDYCHLPHRISGIGGNNPGRNHHNLRRIERTGRIFGYCSKPPKAKPWRCTPVVGDIVARLACRGPRSSLKRKIAGTLWGSGDLDPIGDA